MPSVVNVRLANKVMWALEDIDQCALAALVVWETAYRRAELKCSDPALLVALAKIKGELAQVRILAIEARQGRYAGQRREDEDAE